MAVKCDWKLRNYQVDGEEGFSEKVLRELRNLTFYKKEQIRKIVFPKGKDFAIVLTTWLKYFDVSLAYENTGGLGKSDIIRVIHNDKVKQVTYDWRDQWSSRNDNPRDRVDDIGDIEVKEEEGEGKVIFEVEVINIEYGNWIRIFEF